MCKNQIQSVSQDSEKKDATKVVDFNEALRQTGFGKFNYFLIILSGIVLSSVLLETLSISFVLPVAEGDIDLSTENKGILSSAAYVGIIVSSHLSGFIADTKGRKTMITLSLLLSFVCTIISSFIKNFWGFTFMRFFCGFFISGSSTTIYAYLGEFHTVKMQSRVVMGAAFVFGIGCICVPLIALLIINQEWIFYMQLFDINYKPWRLFIAACGSLSLLSGLCFIFLPESPKFVYSQGDNKRALEILRKVHRYNNGSKANKSYEIREIAKEEIEQSSEKYGLIKQIWLQTAPLFQKELLKTTLLLCSLQFLIFITSSGLYMFFPEILHHTTEWMNSNSLSSTESTICNAFLKTKINNSDSNGVVKLEIETYEYAFLLELIYAGGFALIGLLMSINLSKLLIIEVILFNCALCAVAVSFVSILSLSIYLFVLLLACGLSVNVITTSTIELFPTNLRAMAISLSLMCGRLGSIFGSNFFGLLLDDYCEFTFLFSFFTLMLSCFLVFYIPNISRRTSRECDRSSSNSNDTSAGF